MLNKIIGFSLNNRLTILILSVVMMIAGTVVLFRTEVDIFPDLKNCTASQIQTALASGENTFNACIERANAMIEGAKSENQ